MRSFKALPFLLGVTFLTPAAGAAETAAATLPENGYRVLPWTEQSPDEARAALLGIPCTDRAVIVQTVVEGSPAFNALCGRAIC